MQISNAHLKIILSIIGGLLFTTSQTGHAAEQTAILRQQNPALYQLYQRHSAHHQQLTEYAQLQGYSHPTEKLATILHELIHIDSYTQRAYYFQGKHIVPYLTTSTWPTLTNKNLMPSVTPRDQQYLGPIHTHYIPNTPNNTLANVLDEINAYAQTIPFICTNAPQQSTPHLHALIGHLTLANIYLRTLSQSHPSQYQRLTQSRHARGALETIIANAYITLNQCHQQGIAAADPRPISKRHTQAFANQPKPQ